MSNNNFETGKTCGLVEAEDKSSASLLYERAMAEAKKEHEAQFSHNNFTNLYPPILNKEKNMGKLASFLTGVIVGAVALGVTACLVDQFDITEEDSQNSSCTEDEDDTLLMSQSE